MDELYESLYGSNFTLLPNDFLEKYLSDTKPEYIKVFIFYLWKGIKEQYSVEAAANYLDVSEETVEMALKFWIKKKLIKKEVLNVKENNEKNQNSNRDNLLNFNQKKQELINKNRKSYKSLEQDILFVAEKLLKQPLSERQVALISKCYNEYLFDEELIEYLIEFCSEKGNSNAKYMSEVALTWYEQGAKTIEEAKKIVDSFSTKNKKKTQVGKRDFDRKVDYNDIFEKSALNFK